MTKTVNIKSTHYYFDFYSRLKNIALSRFKWDGLPATCSERFMEKTLFEDGKALFINDKNMSFLNLRAIPSDMLNVYNEPLNYTAYSTGYSEQYSANDCVFIRNNYECLPTDWTISLYAERLAVLEMSLQININALKTPILIRCDDKTKLTLENLYKQYTGDKPVIFATKSLEERPFEVLSTNAPFLVDKFREEKRAVWNEALEFLGLNTNPADKKKERVIVSEVESNNEQIDIQFQTMLLCREKACEEINNMFNLNVSVTSRLEDMNKGGDLNWQNIQ